MNHLTDWAVILTTFTAAALTWHAMNKAWDHFTKWCDHTWPPQ